MFNPNKIIGMKPLGTMKPINKILGKGRIRKDVRSKNQGGIRLGDKQSMSVLPEKFVLITPRNVNSVVQAMGWKDINEFSSDTGVSGKEIIGLLFHLEDGMYVPGTKFNAYQAYNSGKNILFVSGNPSRVSFETFKDYMSMWYRFNGNVMIPK